MREELVAAHSMDRDVRRELLRNYGKLSEILTGEGQMAEAIEHSRRALRLAQQLVTLPGATTDDRRNVANTYLGLGWQLARTQQVGDGILFIRQAIAAFESLNENAPGDVHIRRNLSLAYGRLGDALLNSTDRYEEAFHAHREGLEISQAMLKADPNNTRLMKIVAYAWLGMGSALYQMNQPRSALAEQLKAADLLRDMLQADSHNEMARYDAAFALGEVSATLISLGDLKPAETQLTEALNILSRSSGITAAGLTDAKVLLGLDYYRLGLTHALRASQPTSSRIERNRACAEAQRWFDLGEPILTAANAADEGQWRSLTKDTVAQMTKEPEICMKVLTAAK
jgi:tetratricopeptide (TPR) repeat protein